MKVLVEGLRSTETVGVTRSEIDVFGRIVTEIGTRAENEAFHQAVPVEAASHQYAPAVVLPFVLGICTEDSDGLIRNPVISPHIIPEIVLIVFQSDCQIGWQEDAAGHLIDVLCSTHPGEIGRLSVCIGVLSCTVITFPADML